MYKKCSRCNKRYFELEEDLRIKLLKPGDLWEIEEGIKLYGGFIQKTEYSLIGGNRIDLLCFKTPELIIIELKKYIAKPDVFGQILNYILISREEHSSFGFGSIRGIILAHRISEKLKNLVSQYQNERIDLKEYFIDYRDRIRIGNSICK